MGRKRHKRRDGRANEAVATNDRAETIERDVARKPEGEGGTVRGKALTREQRWASRALERIQQAKESQNADAYKALVMKLPVLLMQSGLVQALVFVQSRDKVGPQMLRDLAAVHGSTDGNTLLKNARSAEVPEYLALSRELVGVATWLRRFAQIELG